MPALPQKHGKVLLAAFFAVVVAAELVNNDLVVVLRPASVDVRLQRRRCPSHPARAAEAEGHEIRTIEGLSQGEKLHPLQEKFLEMAALQCGICTPGFLVAAKNLLEQNPNPTETEVRFWLAGNLCRCTGYDKIIRAVLDTAAEMRGEVS